MENLSRTWMEQDEDITGFVYIDGHVGHVIGMIGNSFLDQHVQRTSHRCQGGLGSSEVCLTKYEAAKVLFRSLGKLPTRAFLPTPAGPRTMTCFHPPLDQKEIMKKYIALFFPSDQHDPAPFIL